MPKTEKQIFMEKVTVLVDTREQVNDHITKQFDAWGVKYESRKLDYGDYTFIYDAVSDFSKSCVIERKANVDELYNNVVQDRGRIEKEMYAASNQAKELILIVESVASWDDLKNYVVPDWQMQRDSQRKNAEIGKVVYATLRSWERGNRYRFKVEFSADKANTAAKMLELFYYYWRNYKEQTAARR